MKLTTTYKVNEGSIELALQDGWAFPSNDLQEEADILLNFAAAIKKRMSHCAKNLLHNKSGVAYNDGKYVVFNDKTRFSYRAYQAMQSILDQIKGCGYMYELGKTITPFECVQLIKAVRENSKLLDIALELHDASIQMERQEMIDSIV